MSEVLCWYVPLDVSPERYYATLADDERRRAARFRFERDRERFVVAHGVLRELLAEQLDSDPCDIRFVRNAFGKPALSPEFGGRLRFSLSHSADLALIAHTMDREIGVDVEHIRPEFDYADIARCFFPAEQLDLPGFFTCWARREAYVKARGVGFGDGPIEFAEGWSVETLQPAPGYVGAVALEQSPSSLPFSRISNQIRERARS